MADLYRGSPDHMDAQEVEFLAGAPDCGAATCGGCSSAAWHWIYRMAQAGRGELRFGITEDGDTGVWWDAYCAGEWTLGAGDTAEEAIARALATHPDPDAEPVVDPQTHARWQAWRAASGAAGTQEGAGRQWCGPYASAAEALDATRRAVAESIGADPETWPEHGNVPLAVAASLVLAQTRAPSPALAEEARHG